MSGEAQASSGARIRLSGSRLGLVILAGPLAGALVYLAATLLFNLPEVSADDIVALGGLVLFFGWLLGLAPAIAAAILVQWLGLSRQPRRRLAEAAAIGCGAALVTTPVMVSVLFGVSLPPLYVLPLFALCGGVALCVTALPGQRAR